MLKMWFLILLLRSFKSFWLLWNWIGDQKFGLIPLDTELFPNRNRVGGKFTIWQFDKLFKGSFDGGSAINILVSFKWVGEYIHLQFVQVHFWIATITFRIKKIQFTVKTNASDMAAPFDIPVSFKWVVGDIHLRSIQCNPDSHLLIKTQMTTQKHNICSELSNFLCCVCSINCGIPVCMYFL